MRGTSRRQALATGAAVVGVAGTAGLVGCGSGSGPDGGPSAAPSSRASGQNADTTLVALDKVPVGGAVSAKDAQGEPLIVAQPEKGTAVAFSAICTHMGCTVAPAGKQLHCPCHGSVYEAATGKNIAGPAPRPLARVAVHVAGGEVRTGGA